jgi:SHS2 domain-containing protein
MSSQNAEASPSPRHRPYRQIPHTADLAWRLWGENLPELFENAGRALSATLTDIRTLRRREVRQVSLAAVDQEALLVDWLNHLLYLFDVDGFVGRDFQVAALTDENLEAEVRGDIFDPTRHPGKTAVKAATYHHLEIGPEDEGWGATVVLDL